MQTIEIPRTGYFVIGPHGLRDGEELTHQHTIPDPPTIGIRDVITPTSGLLSEQAPKPFVSFLVEGLNCIRETGLRLGRPVWTPAYEWLEGNGMIEADRLVKDHPWGIEIRYRVTPAGQSFLAKHEAPLDW